jgi:hypothetical protein
MNKMNVYFKTVKINLTDEEESKENNKYLFSSIGSFSSPSSTNSDFDYKLKKPNEDNLIVDSSELMSHIDNYRLKANRSISKVLKATNISLSFDVSKYNNQNKNRKLLSNNKNQPLLNLNTSSPYSCLTREYEVVPSDVQTLPQLQVNNEIFNENKLYESSFRSFNHFLLRGLKKNLSCSSNKIDNLNYKCYYKTTNHIFDHKYGLQRIKNDEKNIRVEQSNKDNNELIAYWYKTETGNIYSGLVTILKK